MPAIQAAEKSDVKRLIIPEDAGAQVELIVAVMKTPATAIINVSRLSDLSPVQSWQISNQDFLNAGGRVSKQLTLHRADRFQLDFTLYATGPQAEVMFKVSDAQGVDRYRRYRVNAGDAIFDPWGAVAVLTS